MSSNTNIVKIRQEVESYVADKETMASLLQSTFNKMTVEVAKKAMLEAMLRGFTFQNLLQKDVYAVPYSNGYSLITSIDYARKIGMRSGVVGKSKPVYTYKDNGEVESCSITIYRMIGEVKGEFTSEVFFDEYNTGRNLWTSKPRTMIAKVAEMHALRMACPEEASQMYVEEEMTKEIEEETVQVSYEEDEKRLRACKTEEELKHVWLSLSVESKKALESIKNEIKTNIMKSVKLDPESANLKPAKEIKKESSVAKKMREAKEKVEQESQDKKDIEEIAEFFEGEVIS